jgi:hypothetical protein
VGPVEDGDLIGRSRQVGHRLILAKALDLAVAPSLLARADEVIE